MALAKNCHQLCGLNYDSINYIPYTVRSQHDGFQALPTVRDNNRKDVHNPMPEEYKKFIESDVVVPSRDEIINGLENDKDFIIKLAKKSSNTDYITMDKLIDKVFAWVKKIHIVDKSDGWRSVFYKYNITSNINASELISFLPALMRLAADLKTAIQNMSSIVNDMSEEAYLNFAFHTILKGREFYYSSIADPNFCVYLIPDLYHDNIVSIIKSYTKITSLSAFADN